MEMQQVLSSNLRSVGYNSATRTLRVEFVSGALWEYRGVEEGVYQEMLSAPSVGRFFAQSVRPVFVDCSKVETKTPASELPVVPDPATTFTVAGRFYRRTDVRVLRGLVWCPECGRQERIRVADCLRRGWPQCCGCEMTMDSPEERTPVLPGQTEVERAALRLAASPGLLRNRLLMAKKALRGHVEIGQLPASEAGKFANRGFDVFDPDARRLYSKDRSLALQWQVRRDPASPESFRNLQVPSGVVILVEVSPTGEVVRTILEEV